MRVSIIIPAHNEENRIEKTLKEYLAFFSDLKNKKILDFEIIVVLNGCKDRTGEVTRKFKNRELKILDFERGGKGFAIIQGFKEALKNKTDLIGFADADCSTSPQSYYELVKNIDGYDGILANRWDKRSKFEYSSFKKIRSWIYNMIIRSMFGFPYRDTQCGAKLFKKEIIERIINKMISSDFNFDVALLFCLRKEEHAKIKSIPTEWHDREGSKVNLISSPIKMLLGALRLRLIHSHFKFLVIFYRKLPEFMKLHKKF